VLAAAEVLSDYEFNCTIRFIAFSGEELGLRGSAHYAVHVKSLGENITGVINLDMIAYNPAPGSLFVKINRNGHPDCMDLVEFINTTAYKYEPLSQLKIKSGTVSANSDHLYFGPEYKGIHVFEDIFNTNNYHRTSDTIDKLNLTYCSNSTQIAIATVAELAELNTTDIGVPAHTPGFPLPGGFGRAQPAVSIEVTDVSPLNLSSLQLWVNGIPIAPALTTIPLGYNLSYTPVIPFIDSQIINVTVVANDTIGNGFNYSWEFTVDAVAPDTPPNPDISLVRVEAVKRGLVLDIGTYPENDYKHVFAPSIIHQDGEYKMWYTGSNLSNNHLMYANSSDGLTWQKHGIVLYHGVAGDADSVYAQYPSVIYEDGEYKMWYTGNNGATQRIMYANSSDGLSWTKHGLVMDHG
ncbi:MAG: M28 family peptidase, partial [Thermoplasmata archaeon]|nr:M28 family peptidase [Thermoplasmata archaeon]